MEIRDEVYKKQIDQMIMEIGTGLSFLFRGQFVQEKTNLLTSDDWFVLRYSFTLNQFEHNCIVQINKNNLVYVYKNAGKYKMREIIKGYFKELIFDALKIVMEKSK